MITLDTMVGPFREYRADLRAALLTTNWRRWQPSRPMFNAPETSLSGFWLLLASSV